MALDLRDELTATGVEKQGVELDFSHSNNKLEVTLDRTVDVDAEFEIGIAYHGPIAESLQQMRGR